MKKFSAYLLTAGLALTMLGCSKDKDPALTKTQLLTGKNWVVTAETISPGINIGGTVVTDFYAQTEACERDNFLRFETPNVYKSDEGATRCDQSDPQTTTGTWVFNSDESIITVTDPGSSPQNLTVGELTDSSLKLSTTENLGGINYTLTLTFRKG